MGHDRSFRRRHRAGCALAALGFAFAQTGCAAFDQANPIRPAQPSQAAKLALAQSLSAEVAKAEGRYDSDTSDQSRTYDRNEAVTASLQADDQVFEDFAWSAWGADVSVATASDWINLGLTAAASVVTGGASNALAATATAVTGAKTSLQKNLLYSKTVDQLLFAITVTRTQIRTHIQTCLRYPDSQYSLFSARLDLEQYKQAAMLPLAIATLSAGPTAAYSQPDCAGSLTIFTPKPDAASPGLRDWIYPNGTLNTAHRDALQKWMATTATDPALHTAPWSVILDGPYAADRAGAVHDLVPAH